MSEQIVIVDTNGNWHSFDDKPALVYDHGIKAWCKHGEQHRISNPRTMDVHRFKVWKKEDNWFNQKGPDEMNWSFWQNRYTIGDAITLNWQNYDYD